MSSNPQQQKKQPDVRAQNPKKDDKENDRKASGQRDRDEKQSPSNRQEKGDEKDWATKYR